MEPQNTRALTSIRTSSSLRFHDHSKWDIEIRKYSQFPLGTVLRVQMIYIYIYIFLFFKPVTTKVSPFSANKQPRIHTKYLQLINSSGVLRAVLAKLKLLPHPKKKKKSFPPLQNKKRGGRGHIRFQRMKRLRAGLRGGRYFTLYSEMQSFFYINCREHEHGVRNSDKAVCLS